MHSAPFKEKNKNLTNSQCVQLRPTLAAGRSKVSLILRLPQLVVLIDASSQKIVQAPEIGSKLSYSDLDNYRTPGVGYYGCQDLPASVRTLCLLSSSSDSPAWLRGSSSGCLLPLLLHSPPAWEMEEAGTWFRTWWRRYNQQRGWGPGRY